MKIHLTTKQWRAKGPPKPLAKGKRAKAARLEKAWKAKGRSK